MKLRQQAEELGANPGVPSSVERTLVTQGVGARGGVTGQSWLPGLWLGNCVDGHVTNQSAGAVLRPGLGEGREQEHSCKSLKCDVLGVRCELLCGPQAQVANKQLTVQDGSAGLSAPYGGYRKRNREEVKVTLVSENPAPGVPVLLF